MCASNYLPWFWPTLYMLNTNLHRLELNYAELATFAKYLFCCRYVTFNSAINSESRKAFSVMSSSLLGSCICPLNLDRTYAVTPWSSTNLNWKMSEVVKPLCRAKPLICKEKKPIIPLYEFLYSSIWYETKHCPLTASDQGSRKKFSMYSLLPLLQFARRPAMAVGERFSCNQFIWYL